MGRGPAAEGEGGLLAAGRGSGGEGPGSGVRGGWSRAGSGRSGRRPVGGGAEGWVEGPGGVGVGGGLGAGGGRSGRRPGSGDGRGHRAGQGAGCARAGAPGGETFVWGEERRVPRRGSDGGRERSAGGRGLRRRAKVGTRRRRTQGRGLRAGVRHREDRNPRASSTLGRARVPSGKTGSGRPGGERRSGSQLPEPLGPMMQVNLLKGPMTWRPRHDLKFSTSNSSRRPMAAPSAPQAASAHAGGKSAGSARGVSREDSETPAGERRAVPKQPGCLRFRGARVSAPSQRPRAESWRSRLASRPRGLLGSQPR